MSTGGRVALAFLASPLVAAVVTTLLLTAIGWAPYPGFVLPALVFAYLTMLVLGVPAFLMTRPYHLKSRLAHLFVGLTIALVPAVIFGSSLGKFNFALFASISAGGAVAGFVFGLFMTLNLPMRSNDP
jgi:hypothetical protein